MANTSGCLAPASKAREAAIPIASDAPSEPNPIASPAASTAKALGSIAEVVSSAAPAKVIRYRIYLRY